MATQNQIAKHLDMSVTALKKMLESVDLPTQGCSLDTARIAYIRKLRKVAAGRASENGDYDLTEERAKLAHFQAEKTELETEVLRGKLIPADEVLDQWEKLAASFRAKMLSLPIKAGHQLVNLQEYSDIEDVLKSHIYDALNELTYETDTESSKESKESISTTH